MPRMTQTLTGFDSLVQCAALDYLHQSRCKRVWRLVLLLHLSSYYPALGQRHTKPLKVSGGSVRGSGGSYDHCATSQCTRLFCSSRKNPVCRQTRSETTIAVWGQFCANSSFAVMQIQTLGNTGSVVSSFKPKGISFFHQLRVSIILCSRQQRQTLETSTQVVLHLNSWADIHVLQRTSSEFKLTNGHKRIYFLNAVMLRCRPAVCVIKKTPKCFA